MFRLSLVASSDLGVCVDLLCFKYVVVINLSSSGVHHRFFLLSFYLNGECPTAMPCTSTVYVRWLIRSLTESPRDARNSINLCSTMTERCVVTHVAEKRTERISFQPSITLNEFNSGREKWTNYSNSEQFFLFHFISFGERTCLLHF